MNIAILLLNKGRGSGEVARSQASYLSKIGHKVYFLQPNIGDVVEKAINIDIPLHTDIIPVHENLPSALSKQKQVSEMSIDEMSLYLDDYENSLSSIAHDIDLFIGHHANLTAVAVSNVAKKYNKPYVLFLHGTGIEPRYEGKWDDENWELIKKSIIDSSGIIVTTKYVRDELVKPLIPLDNKHFLVLPIGVDINKFHPDNVGDIINKYNLPDKYVISPGALIFSKGAQNIVDASNFYSDFASTIFIGDGYLRSSLEKSLGSRGKFLGFVSSEDKIKLINAATLLVAAPEKKEHFGIIYPEALAGGTPVVAYEGGGVNSIVTKSEGVLTKRDSSVLGREVNNLLRDNILLKEMSISCRLRAEKYFDEDKLNYKLSNWLKSFI